MGIEPTPEAWEVSGRTVSLATHPSSQLLRQYRQFVVGNGVAFAPIVFARSTARHWQQRDHSDGSVVTIYDDRGLPIEMRILEQQGTSRECESTTRDEAGPIGEADFEGLLNASRI